MPRGGCDVTGGGSPGVRTFRTSRRRRRTPLSYPRLGVGPGPLRRVGRSRDRALPTPSAEGFHTHGSQSTAGGAMTDAPWPNREATAHCMTGGPPRVRPPAPLGTGEHPPFAFSKEAEAPPTSHPKGALGRTTPPRPRGAGLIRGVGSPTRPPWMTGSVLADFACGHHEGVPSPVRTEYFRKPDESA